MSELGFGSCACGSSSVYGRLALDLATASSSAVDVAFLSGWYHGRTHVAGFLARSRAKRRRFLRLKVQLNSTYDTRILEDQDGNMIGN